MKHFAGKSFSVLRGVNGTPPSTLKLFPDKYFIIFFLTLMKNKFYYISQDLLHNNLLVLFNNVFCYYKEINNDGNKWLLLDVSPKTMFLDVQWIPKAPKLKKCLKKNNSWVIWL